ncbi:hypothetical protein MRB53_038448 [Persea americana]|nr:hypothetical protein MRB53_038448 [Persea americana]
MYLALSSVHKLHRISSKICYVSHQKHSRPAHLRKSPSHCESGRLQSRLFGFVLIRATCLSRHSWPSQTYSTRLLQMLLAGGVPFAGSGRLWSRCRSGYVRMHCSFVPVITS